MYVRLFFHSASPFYFELFRVEWRCWCVWIELEHNTLRCKWMLHGFCVHRLGTCNLSLRIGESNAGIRLINTYNDRDDDFEEGTVTYHAWEKRQMDRISVQYLMVLCVWKASLKLRPGWSRRIIMALSRRPWSHTGTALILWNGISFAWWNTWTAMNANTKMLILIYSRNNFLSLKENH